MQNPDVDALSTADLAEAEVELPEWDRLRVRDFWEAVIAEELGARQSPASSYAWLDVADVPDQRPVLRVIAGGGSGVSAVGSGEAA